MSAKQVWYLNRSDNTVMKSKTGKTDRCVHLLSGGLDSTVMLYDLLAQDWDVRCIGFEYGQTHVKELDAARSIARRCKVPFDLIQLHVFSGSSLLGGNGSIIVPNRNMVFLSIAAAMAESDGRAFVTYGCTQEDWHGFPDCRPTFIVAMNESLRQAGIAVRIRTPYVELTKRDVVDIGRKRGAPIKDTWSCYAGGKKPCGKCEACKKRNAALK